MLSDLTRSRGGAVLRRLVALPAAALLASGAAAQVSFNAGELVSNAYVLANSAIACDIDGDGDQDVLSSWVQDNAVTWHENLDGTATTWAIHVVTTAAMGMRYAHAADVDGDGDLDVLSASCNDDEVSWYENVNGDGLLWKEISITVWANCAQYVNTEDVDQDGDLDVVVASFLDSKVSWHENTVGDGTVWVEHFVTWTGIGGREVKTADLNTDGNPDVIAAWSDSNQIAWLDNLAGDGSAWTQTAITTDSLGADSVVLADFDGDGDLDAAGGSFADGTVAWHENALGDGSVWIKHVIATGATLTDSIDAADVDQDGDWDLISAIFGKDEFAFFENVSGDASAWAQHTITTSADGARRARIADVDLDGDLDLLGANYEGGEVVLYRNVTPQPEAIAYGAAKVIDGTINGPRGIASADMDRDGDADLVVASVDDDRVAWYENTFGDASAWALRVVSSALDAPQVAVPLDLDDDGDLDVLSAAALSNAITWHENLLGDASSWLDHAISAASLDARDVLGADLDGDGDLDAVSASAGDDTLAWHENLSGDASAWAFHPIAVDALSARSVFVVDLDRDGDLDVLAAAYGSDEVAWYANTTGDGTVWTKTVVTGSALGAEDAVALDFDFDGDVDVVAVSSLDHTVAWHENLNGAGTAWQPHVVAADATAAQSVTARDLDRDGDPDVLVASFAADNAVWHENLGTGGLTWQPHPIAVKLDGAAGAHAVDLNGDGFLDVAAAAQIGDTLVWSPGRASQKASVNILACPDNPVGSLVHLAGAPAIGSTVTLGIDNPLGSMPIGSLPVLAIAAFPYDPSGTVCGVAIPGLGLGTSPGMVQISVAGASLLGVLVGPAWQGVGTPSAITIPIPASVTLVEYSAFAQGAMIDLVSGKIGLTEAAELLLGP